MKNILGAATIAATLLIFTGVVAATEAPVYKEGDWWRVKVDTVFKPGISRTGRCDEAYPEYVVKIDQGKPKIFSVSGNKEEEIDCPTIANELLNVGPEAGRYLKFPLAVNNSWTFQGTGRGPRGPIRFNENLKVQAWEKIKSPRGELDAFRIEASYSTPFGGDVVTAFHYSPTIKCIVSFNLVTPAVARTVTLVDFNVSQ